VWNILTHGDSYAYVWLNVFSLNLSSLSKFFTLDRIGFLAGL
jgi:hypothetical protein